MRLFFKEPIYEYYPYDSVNSVPFIYQLKKECPFRLAHPYANWVVDPTRRLANTKSVYHFQRSEVEMWHMTYIRKDIRGKLTNVSNKGNYGTHISEFLTKWENWTLSDGPLHPHPYISKFFDSVRTTPNIFKIDLQSQCQVCCISRDLQRCSRCKWAKYCSSECQTFDYPQHKQHCQPPPLPKQP
jgi:hypothetical protein